jgi:hypothetical protein
MRTWREMSQFEGVDLEDTGVLGWRYSAEEGVLVFDVDASLWPGHAAYEPPKSGEWACYKAAQLVFIGARVAGNLPSPTDATRTVGPDGSIDFGTFGTLLVEEDGEYRLVADFADLLIRCDRVELRVVEG